MKKRGSILALLLVVTLIGFCSTTPPKREMRSAWLATVWRIDWPTTAMTSVTATNINKQKNELITILDSVKAANMNAIFFQVRPEADAFYQSAYEPWSAHLGGARGTYPGYDPLAFAIEEAHKRGIELHAWLNPYRFESVSGKYSGQPGDYRASHPEWILDYSTPTKTDITIFDPGNPGVRKLIKNIVGDILSKYDVDGIVFDDYFYAYGGTSSTLDSYSQNLYKPANMSLADWRRDNINKMIADVYDTIQIVKPYVTFGVSPFGIWTTNSAVAQARGLTLPQGITGLDAYSVIYCDPVAWLEQGKVDYISPQLYWTTTSSGQDYDVLCPWWSDVVYRYGKHFYSSMSLSSLSSTYQVRSSSEGNVDTIPSNLHELKKYMLNGGLTTGLTRTEMRIISSVAFDDNEIGLQIDRNRLSTKNAAPGHVFYSVKHLVTNGKFTKYLREQKFTSSALTPAIGWKTHPTLTAPTNVTRTGNTLSWSYSGSNVRFAVYAIPNSQVGNPAAFENINNLLGITYTKQFNVTKYSSLYNTHTFLVSTVDRYGNEFLPVESAPVDPPIVPTDTLQLTQLWEFSVQKGNLGTAVDDVQNGFAIRKDGSKLYLGTRNNGSNQVAIYNAATGERAGYLPALSGFSSAIGGDVAVDDNGAIYACNVVNGGTGALQVAKWDSETDASPQIIISTTSHGGSDANRIGYGVGVKIDASGNGFILMHKGGTSEFKIWKISGGTPVSQNPTTITATPTITDAYARISIVDNNHFWIDGNANYPHYGTITWSGGNPTSISLQVINPNGDLNSGVGGATEFSLGGKRYLVAARNNHGDLFTDKHSALLKQLGTGTAIINQNVLGTPLPTNGLGATTDPSHFVESNIYVSGNTAYVYLMGGFNGIAGYKLMNNSSGFTPAKFVYQILPTPTGIQINLDKTSMVEIYNINGVLIDKKEVIGTYICELKKGIYLIRIDNQVTKFIK